MAHIFSLNRSDGGVPKYPVHEASVTINGMAGDRQRNLKYHGGPQPALCLYALERILQLQQEGHPIFPGSVGENVTITGLQWEQIVLGTRLRLGDVEIEITTYTIPCRNISASFADGRSKRISQKINPGMSRLYARVLREGTLRIGDSVEIMKAKQTT